MNKSALTRSIGAEFRDVVIARTARIRHHCVCAAEFRSFTVTSTWPKPVNGILSVSSTWPNRASAETHADWARGERPEAEVSIEPRPNANYRPDCLGEIQPGDVYGEYLGEAGAYESGTPYCARCAAAVWHG